MGRKWMKRRLLKKYIEDVPNVPGVYEILMPNSTIYAGKSLGDGLLDHFGKFRGILVFVL